MIPLTAEQLADYLIRSAEEAFPKADANEIITVTAAMLLLKRAADQPGRYWISRPRAAAHDRAIRQPGPGTQQIP